MSESTDETGTVRLYAFTPRFSSLPPPTLELKDGKHRCRASVSKGMFSSSQCDKPGKEQTTDGLWWCGIHGPSREMKRRAIGVAKYEADRLRWSAEAEKQREKAELIANAPRWRAVLEQIAKGHNDPRALAAEALAKTNAE